jgi:hypothetical protein
MRATTAVLAVALGLLLCGSAAADNKFHAMPAAKAERGNLQVRVVSYDGSTNGELTVQVKNTSKKPMVFIARGLYFVPDGDPDQAPQRLGAVGPFEIATDKEDAAPARAEKVTIAAGQTVDLTLDVFCIDSHRASPSPSTPFTVGKTKMPATLAADIDKNARRAAKGKAAAGSGYAAPAAAADVQAEVWKARDAKWIKLDGEGDQEAAK